MATTMTLEQRQRQAQLPAVERDSSTSAMELTTTTTTATASSSAPATNIAEAEDVFRPVTKRQQALVLASAFLAIFTTVGINQTYGVFQDYYTSPGQDMLPAAETHNRALIAFVGTLGAGLTWAGSIYVNPAMARLRSPKPLVAAGVLLSTLAFALASLATRALHLLLTQGLLYGAASALVYFPPVAVAPEYFDARRGAAMGFVLSASGLGGLALAPATRALLSALGARGTLRALAALNFALGIPVVALCPATRSRRARPSFVDVRVARSPLFAAAVAGAFLQSGGYFVPLTFLSTFTGALGYSASFGAVLLGVSNGVNAASRIAVGAAADVVGRQNALVACCAGSAVAVLALWAAAAAAGARAAWLVFVVVYGVCSGGYHALLPTTIADVFGVQAYASINGLLYFVRGCGVFFGSPVGGTILGDTVGAYGGPAERKETLRRFRGVVWYDGALLAACTVCVVLTRLFHARERGVWKWKA